MTRDGLQKFFIKYKGKKNYKILFALIIVIFCISIFKYYRSINHTHLKVVASPVEVALVFKKDIPVYLSALGTVTSTATITVRTQVNGQLIKVYFQDGQKVKAGDLIAEIDSRPYLRPSFHCLSG